MIQRLKCTHGYLVWSVYIHTLNDTFDNLNMWTIFQVAEINTFLYAIQQCFDEPNDYYRKIPVVSRF